MMQQMGQFQGTFAESGPANAAGPAERRILDSLGGRS
jgi:hypothetical protein